MAPFVERGIEKLGRQHYRVWWTERATQKQRSRVLRGPLADARRLRDEMEDSQTRGAYVPPDALTLRQYCDSWCDRRESLGGNRDSTNARDRQLLASVCSRLGSMKLQDLTRTHIEDYYVWCLTHEITRRGALVSAETVNKRHKTLKRALEDAVQAEPPLIQRNPAARAKHPPASRPHGQAWTADELQMVLATVSGSRFEMPAMIAAHTGLRIGEVLAVRWKDLTLPESGGGSVFVDGQVVEDESGCSRVSYAKTSSSRAPVGFGEVLGDTLRAHKKAQAAKRLALGEAWEDNGLVVAGNHGQVLRPSKLSGWFSAIVAMLEEHDALDTTGATFHVLRHTHATLLLKDRVPVHVVSQRLRHSRIQTTLDHYAHVIPGDDEAAVESFETALSGSYGAATVHIDYTSEDDKRAVEAAL